MSSYTYVKINIGTGQCQGATVELGLNYIADLSTKKTGGMFKVEDVPYSPDSMTLSEKCAEITKDKSPHVGITGWTRLPSNDYKTTMNAIAKVSLRGGAFISLFSVCIKIHSLVNISFFLYHSLPGRTRCYCRSR